MPSFAEATMPIELGMTPEEIIVDECCKEWCCEHFEIMALGGDFHFNRWTAARRAACWIAWTLFGQDGLMRMGGHLSYGGASEIQPEDHVNEVSVLWKSDPTPHRNLDRLHLAFKASQQRLKELSP